MSCTFILLELFPFAYVLNFTELLILLATTSSSTILLRRILKLGPAVGLEGDVILS
jgi:hypothetical protein